MFANAVIWPGDGRSMVGHVMVSRGKIEAVRPGRYRGAWPVVDLRGFSLSPGLIDLMVIGGFDKSLLRDDPLDLAREYLKRGVTACPFCTGILPWKRMRQIAENVRRAKIQIRVALRKSSERISDRRSECLRSANLPNRNLEGCANLSARILGLYWEGPFQDPAMTGASLREHALLPAARHVRRLLKDLGDLTQPEGFDSPGDALDAIIEQRVVNRLQVHGRCKPGPPGRSCARVSRPRTRPDRRSPSV